MSNLIISKVHSKFFFVLLHLSSLSVVQGPQHLLHGSGSAHDWLLSLTDRTFGHLLLARATLKVSIGTVEDLGRGWHGLQAYRSLWGRGSSSWFWGSEQSLHVLFQVFHIEVVVFI